MRAYIGAVDDTELTRLLTGEKTEPIYICRIERKVASALGATTTAVWLSRYTVEKQESKHKDKKAEVRKILARLYSAAPFVIENGEPRKLKEEYNKGETPRVLYLHDGKPFGAKSFVVYIKAIKGGQEIYIESVYRVDDSAIRRARRQSDEI